ncbi:prepilin-type N-terminal cleavage/methylation domain-containing protein [Vibrio sp. SM6]|uniref:Type II secretion system protein H n=1 Tax=Vibrio agarilyticus TaxID=2726741 RepID=A0A7X8YI14_9VIBR|nr:GspH/FimT family pseudopilin [Vibrio agarilyticus]NLS14111.1 prepilin-type N-terminal cleavage/methylation domain-containing protein [Vibrio agarilyticus]
MNRGFSLIELMITCVVVAALLSFAVPSFRDIQQRAQITRLAEELNGFLLNAKSEAALRNQDLVVAISSTKETTVSDGGWVLSLQDPSGKELQQVSGVNFPNTTFTHNYSSKKITFDNVRGWPTGGAFNIAPLASVSHTVEVRLSNPPGRIRLCGASQPVGHYEECP